MNAQTMWDTLPSDACECIMNNLGVDIVAVTHVHDGTETYWMTPDERIERLQEFRLLCRAFANGLKSALIFHSSPLSIGHAEMFIEAVLRLVFDPPIALHRALMVNHTYEFLYTAVYTGCTQRDQQNQASRYYRLLGHKLTRLLKTRAIPWKGTDAVAHEIRLLSRIFKYVDRFFVKLHALPVVAERLHKAYLDGDPDNGKVPTYNDPPLPPANYRVDVG